MSAETTPNETRKNPFFDWMGKNLGIILSAITTLFVAYLTFHGAHVDADRKQKHDDSLFTMEYNYKKALIIQQFMPYILSDDSVKVKLAIISFWTMDTVFAVRTVNMLKSEGAKNAIEYIVHQKSRANRERTDASVGNKPDKTPGDVALFNAVSELNKSKLPGSQGLKDKYLQAAGAKPEEQWSVPFIIWCFRESQKLEIKTNDLTTFFEKIKAAKLLLNPSDSPRPGDIVFFNFQESKGPEQCGIVSGIDKSYVYTIEADNNGEPVSAHIRYKDDVLAFARVK